MHDHIQRSVDASNVVLKWNEAEVRRKPRGSGMMEKLACLHLRPGSLIDRATHYVELHGGGRLRFFQYPCCFDEETVTLPTCVGGDQTEGRGFSGWGREPAQLGEPVRLRGTVLEVARIDDVVDRVDFSLGCEAGKIFRDRSRVGHEDGGRSYSAERWEKPFRCPARTDEVVQMHHEACARWTDQSGE